MSRDPILFQFFNEIGIIEQLSRNWFEQMLPHGLKLSHFSMLNHLVRLGDGKSPVELARSFQVTKAAITNTISRLKKRGFVEEKPHPTDLRSKLIYLTEEGRICRDDAVGAASKALQLFSDKITIEEFEATLPLLTKVRTILDNERSQIMIRNKIKNIT